MCVRGTEEMRSIAVLRGSVRYARCGVAERMSEGAERAKASTTLPTDDSTALVVCLTYLDI